MEEAKLRKGPWLEEEDEQLIAIVALKGERRWDSLAKASDLRRSGKSCRLRWMNYLRPNLKHGGLSAEEERTILQLHKQWGNKWAKMAQSLPGRTDNEIKNYWRSHLRKKAQVKEQGYCESFTNNVTNNVKQDLFVPEYKPENYEDPLHMYELSNYAIANSPYETCLSDWLSGWSNEQIEVSQHGDCSSLDLSFCYPVLWSSEDSDTSIRMWDSSSSLWDKD